MQKVKAYYNWNAGWIWDCPECNDEEFDGTKPNISERAVEGEPGICSKCYPGVIATMPVIFQGAPMMIPDLAARQRAREQAEADGRIYEVVFPRHQEAIMHALRKRPPRNRSWWPGITVKELERENKEHGVE